MATDEGDAFGTSEGASDASAPNERDIGGVQYKCKPLGFSAGLPLLKRLLEIVAPVMAAGLRGQRAFDRMANVLDVLPTAFSLDDIARFSKAFGNCSHYLSESGQWVLLLNNGKVNAQETHFTGRYDAFLKWLIFCIEVNFAGFFSGAMTATNGNEGETLNPFGEFMAMLKGSPQAKAASSVSGTTSSSE